MSYEIVLAWVCGCRETWPVVLEPDPDQLVMHSSAPCIPESCPTCIEHHALCQTREKMRSTLYRPVEWIDTQPIPRKRKWERLKGTGSQSEDAQEIAHQTPIDLG